MINQQLTPYLQVMRQRVQTLYQRGSSLSQQNDILAAAFEELEFALEQLQSAEVQQRRQQEEWLNCRAELESETKNYQELFVKAPAGYLVTSLDGTIRRANVTAAKLLQSSERSLVGRSLALFVPQGQRRVFRVQLAQAAQADGVQEWELSMQGWESAQFDAGLTVVAVRGKNSQRPLALHWLLRDISARKQAQQALQETAVQLSARRGGSFGKPEQDARPAFEQSSEHAATLARQHFAFLSKASVLISVSQDIDSMIGHIAYLAVPAIADGCVIDLAEPQTGTVQQLVAVRESSEEYFVRTWRRTYTPQPLLARSVGQTIAPPVTAQVALGQQASVADLRTSLGELMPTSAIVAPLQIEDRVLGSVTFVLAGADRQYDTVDVALLEELVRQLALAVERIRR